MNKDEIFIDGIRKYICVGYSETEKPIYELNPEYEKYIKQKSPQNLPKADAYSVSYPHKTCVITGGDNDRRKKVL